MKSNRCDMPDACVTNADIHSGITKVMQLLTTFLHEEAFLEAIPSMESIMVLMKNVSITMRAMFTHDCMGTSFQLSSVMT